VLLESGESKRFAYGYEREVLTPVVAELARLCAPAGELPLEPPQEPPKGVPMRAVERVAVRLNRPANSRVNLEEHADGVTLIIPPLGLWRGSMGLFFAGLMISAVAGVISLLILPPMIAINQFDLPALIPVGLFFVGGLVMLTIAVHMGRRRSVIAVVGGRLMVMQTGLFGSWRREWDRDDLNTITINPCAIVVNNRPVPQLQIQPFEGARISLLTGRDETELDWIAAVLSRALKLTGEPGEFEEPKVTDERSP
jgi:hypothetical protein